MQGYVVFVVIGVSLFSPAMKPILNSTLLLGETERERTTSNLILTRFASDRPPSNYQCQLYLRQLPTASDWKGILRYIIEDPKKHYLLRTVVLAGRWDETQYGDEMANAGPWRLVARDKIAECRQWERSLSPTMKAARCGDLAAITTCSPTVPTS